MTEEVKSKQEDSDNENNDKNKEVDEIVSEIAEKVDGFFYNQEPQE